jgi:hypothetical protein
MVNNEDQGKWAQDIDGWPCKIAYVEPGTNLVILISMRGELFFQSRDVISVVEMDPAGNQDYKKAFENLMNSICEKERKRYLEMDKQRKEKTK